MSDQEQQTKPDGGASVSTVGLGGTRFDSQAWLTEALQDGTPRHRRLSFLITANGGLRVLGWGFIGYGNGHQSGLEQDDALELMQWSAFMDGLEAAGVEILVALRPYFEAYQAEFVTPNVQIEGAARLLARRPSRWMGSAPAEKGQSGETEDDD